LFSVLLAAVILHAQVAAACNPPMFAGRRTGDSAELKRVGVGRTIAFCRPPGSGAGADDEKRWSVLVRATDTADGRVSVRLH
jgi:hypothetical protein